MKLRTGNRRAKRKEDRAAHIRWAEHNLMMLDRNPNRGGATRGLLEWEIFRRTGNPNYEPTYA